ncbi:hypothetical protein ABT340_42165 [Streptosporangium sp. NPDC000239]|uniref:hypothetical protein n=1 Tax=Streptosporangium sp. NPDC000239 TaxID=3154248 RepID=UPI00331EE708
MAVAALGAYFTTMELEQADHLAGVISLFVAVAGLGVAIVGLRSGPGGRVRQVAKARGNSRIYQAGRDLTQHPSARPGSKAGESGRSSDGAQGDGSQEEGALGDGPREVSQQAEADRGSQVRQVGRDLTTSDADEGYSDDADEEGDAR